jgi:hypothetical protein
VQSRASSGGSFAQPVPVVRTNRMPSGASRSSRRGRPPGPRPGSGAGISGSSRVQRRSSTSRRGGRSARRHASARSPRRVSAPPRRAKHVLQRRLTARSCHCPGCVAASAPGPRCRPGRTGDAASTPSATGRTARAGPATGSPSGSGRGCLPAPASDHGTADPAARPSRAAEAPPAPTARPSVLRSSS